MIRNERQYKVTKGQVSRLEAALGADREAKPKMAKRVFEAMVAGIQSQIDDLEQELKEYRDLTKVEALPLRSADDLPELLVRARVARGYTQKELAVRLNLKPQQIHKYEATGYRSASLGRVIEVLDLIVAFAQADERIRAVGQAHGFRFPAEDGEKARAFLEHVSKLPEDAKSIF